jgi:hypothetical protein
MTKPTCTTDGLKVRVCSVCSEVESAPVAAVGHTSGEWVIVTEPTETSEGLRERSCAVCGEVMESEEIPVIALGYTDGLVFTLNNAGTAYSVNGYNGSSTDVVIPATYEGLPVTNIGDAAFSYGTLMSVTIPDSVTSIGVSAFYGCSSLTSVTIPDSVTNISHYAFHYCSSLTSVTFENTNGWWISTDSTATSGTAISADELADPSAVAQYLTSTYRSHYWKRS